MSNSLIESMTAELAFDGQPANVITLTNIHGMSMTVMDIGATWLSCLLPLEDAPREVLLGVNSMADFNKQSVYLGATVGRYANRIAKGKVTIEGQDYQLETNQAGNTLHGGVIGFDKKRWLVAKQDDHSVTFSLDSKDGEQGFPGNLNVEVTYQLSDDNQVVINYRAITDKTTVVNLTNHGYFNLMGAESNVDCLDSILKIEADQYLPTNEVGIPLGELASVEGTSFDFRQEKKLNQDFLADEQQTMAKGYDHSFLLNDQCQVGERAATMVSPDKKVVLSLFTTKPAIQLYTGNWLAGTPNRHGGEYNDYSGFALETQFLPDSPNHPEWPKQNPIIEPNVHYKHSTCYQFIYE
ncbi:galactose-1-epimerase [Vibrio sp. SS-MA-C1-2]|uniref:galactose-1-epimerase n=1 Tax=Vibrio sp. SS-MA-C1-2 TaxID=2908646 RepID=UPI001F3F5587|nr:galactose-1-epimerase [Vibrio sp. SS-MA-C1-2]UJF17529.1 galactose-1-epimerase [Vibrio sp. SS-MA-C1-2]